MNILRGKTALITGATGGLGSSLAMSFAEMGINLLLTSTNLNELKNLQKELNKKFKSIDIEIIQCNLIENFKSFLGYFDDDGMFGEKVIDILVNNAALFPANALKKTSEEEIIQTMFLNATFPILLAKKLSKNMMSRNFGRIINIGSSSSYSGFKNTVTYCSSKHAILGFSRALHQEFKDYNLRVYCVSPGSLKTNMGLKVIGQKYESFIECDELSTLIVDLIKYNNNMIPDEIRVNRMETQ